MNPEKIMGSFLSCNTVITEMKIQVREKDQNIQKMAKYALKMKKKSKDQLKILREQCYILQLQSKKIDMLRAKLRKNRREVVFEETDQ